MFTGIDTLSEDVVVASDVYLEYTMVENGKKHRQNSHLIIQISHERGSERSEQASERVSAAEGMSEASSPEQANK